MQGALSDAISLYAVNKNLFLDLPAVAIPLLEQRQQDPSHVPFM